MAGYLFAQRAGHRFAALPAQLAAREQAARQVQQVVELHLAVIVLDLQAHLYVKQVAVPLAQIGSLLGGLGPVVKARLGEPNEDG
jgi:hypothetical protein